jgi:hypothetical protein
VSERSQLEKLVLQFFEALNSEDAGGVPLSEHVVFGGMLTPEPVRGRADVRAHLQQIAPFIRNIRNGNMVIEDGAVAVPVKFEAVNGVVIEGAFFFSTEDGAFTLIRALFDTHPLMTGRSDSQAR